MAAVPRGEIYWDKWDLTIGQEHHCFFGQEHQCFFSLPSK